MNRYYAPLLPEKFYHVFNRAIGNEKCFLNEDNYLFFLKKLEQYIFPVADVYAYSLLPNHFHLVIKVRSHEEIAALREKQTNKKFGKENDISIAIMQQFSNLINSYTKAFNKVYNRKGSLFIDHLRRSEAKDDADVKAFIFYVHKNAVHHALTKAIGIWQFDSFKSLLSNKPTRLAREAVLELFGGGERFIEFHHQEIEIKNGFADIDS
ncbi:MAG: transposase [Lacibacter sp.]